ncbi:MAG: hypothetical protein LBR22_04735 [Desulfovibrio sp.]|nr:hypothetical protein [Desulfovibrio sp.]
MLHQMGYLTQRLESPSKSDYVVLKIPNEEVRRAIWGPQGIARRKPRAVAERKRPAAGRKRK